MDAYDRKARLYPAAMVIAPMTLLGLLLFGVPAWWSGLAGFAAAGGLHFALIQFVRDRGHAKEADLWRTWNGAPTTHLLRWSEATNPILLEQRHVEVARATGVTLPASAEEAADPVEADNRYEAAVSVLRDRTRGKGYELVGVQLANYGFRRNTFGRKLFGIAVAILVVVGGSTVGVLALTGVLPARAALMFAAAGAAALWLILWVFAINPNYVRRAGDRYAEALVAAAGRVLPPQ